MCFYVPLHFKRILLTILTCPSYINIFKITRSDEWSDVDARLVAMGARHDGATLLSALRAPGGAEGEEDVMAIATSTALALLTMDSIDVTETDEEGRTTLHHACLNTLDEVALRLIELGGVDVNAKCKSDGTTVLWCACKMQLESVALALLLRVSS